MRVGLGIATLTTEHLAQREMRLPTVVDRQARFQIRLRLAPELRTLAKQPQDAQQDGVLIVRRQPAFGLLELARGVGEMAFAVDLDQVGIPVARQARANSSAASRSPLNWETHAAARDLASLASTRAAVPSNPQPAASCVSALSYSPKPSHAHGPPSRRYLALTGVARAALGSAQRPPLQRTHPTATPRCACRPPCATPEADATLPAAVHARARFR